MADMNKSLVYAKVVLELLRSPKHRISERRMFELCQADQVSKKTYGRYIKELTGDPICDGHPVLKKIEKDHEGESLVFFELNRPLFEFIYPENLDTVFYLQAFEKVGHLLDSPVYKEDIEEVKAQLKENLEIETSLNLERKFHYISKIKERFNPFSDDDRVQDEVVTALINDRKISFMYNNKVREEICPLTLCQYRDALYLVSTTEDDLKKKITYKLSRMSEVKIEGEFSYPTEKKWNPVIHFKDASGIIVSDPKVANIKVYGHARTVFKEKDLFHAKEIASNVEYDTYELTYTGPQEFLGQLFVYANEIEIITPESLKESFKEKALEALLRNGDGGYFDDLIKKKVA